MIIHCTKKLAAKLENVSNTPLAENSSIGSWHANLYQIDRRQCVMLCHDKTRFVLFMAGLKKDDFANLDFWFKDLYANTMLKMAYAPELIEKAMAEVDDLQFDSCCNRSVQGTIRVAMQDLDTMLWQGPNVMDLPIYSISAHLNGRPVTTKGMRSSECLWPQAAMKVLIEAI